MAKPMSVSRLRIAPATLIAGSLAALMLSACGGGGGDSSSSTPAPSNFAVVAGDGQATVTWDDNTAYQYWLYYAPSVSFSTVEQWSKLTGAQSKVGYNNDKGIRPPMVVTSLTNGTTYYFAMNGRDDGGKGGPLSATLSAIPRASGDSWLTGGTFTGNPTLRSTALGTDSNDSTSVYVAVGDGGVVYSAPAYTSTSALSWTSKATLGGQLNGVVYTLSKFVSVGTGGKTWYSTTPGTWTAGTISDAGTANLNALASNGATVVAVGDNGRIVYSTDGQSWTPAAAVPASTPNLYGVTYSVKGQWIAVGANCTMLTSTDGSTWTTQAVTLSGAGCTDLRSVDTVAVTTNSVTTYYFAAVGTGATGGAIITSSDGSTFTQLADVGSAPLYAVAASSDGRFAAVGASNAIYIATAINTWVAPTTKPTPGATMYGITRANATYTAVGAGGASIYSY